MIFIKTDSAIETLKRLNVKLSAAQIARVESRAINNTIGIARTRARTQVKNVYNISQKNLKSVNFQPATPAITRAKLYAGRKPIGLDAFSPKQETNTGSVRITKRGAQKVTIFKRAKSNPISGISVEIFKGKRQVIPYAFILANGAVRVFARGEYKTGTQYGFVQRFHRVNSAGNDIPIKPLITVSEFGMLLNDQVMGVIGKEVKRIYPVKFENQVEYLLSTIG